MTIDLSDMFRCIFYHYLGMTQIANIWNMVSSVVKDYVESEKNNFENLDFRNQ